MRNLTIYLSGLATFMPLSAATVYLGDDQAASSILHLDRAPALARADFESILIGGVSTEDFEGQTVGDSGPITLNFNGTAGLFTATLTGSGGPGDRIQNGVGVGPWATSGTQNWLAISPFTVDFGSVDVAAFAFT